VLIALMIFGFAQAASADKKTAAPVKTDEKAKPAAPPAPASATTADKLTGEIVDITCYADHDAHGDKHASCAQKCLTAGMPVGLLSDGKLYIVTMKDHSAPSAKLATFGGKSVVATGKRVEKDGTRVFELDTDEPAGK
jgi:hypothetical protein